jgi:hypothetical protein
MTDPSPTIPALWWRSARAALVPGCPPGAAARRTVATIAAALGGATYVGLELLAPTGAVPTHGRLAMAVAGVPVSLALLLAMAELATVRRARPLRWLEARPIGGWRRTVLDRAAVVLLALVTTGCGAVAVALAVGRLVEVDAPTAVIAGSLAVVSPTCWTLLLWELGERTGVRLGSEAARAAVLVVGWACLLAANGHALATSAEHGIEAVGGPSTMLVWPVVLRWLLLDQPTAAWTATALAATTLAVTLWAAAHRRPTGRIVGRVHVALTGPIGRWPLEAVVVIRMVRSPRGRAYLVASAVAVAVVCAAATWFAPADPIGLGAIISALFIGGHTVIGRAVQGAVPPELALGPVDPDRWVQAWARTAVGLALVHLLVVDVALTAIGASTLELARGGSLTVAAAGIGMVVGVVRLPAPSDPTAELTASVTLMAAAGAIGGVASGDGIAIASLVALGLATGVAAIAFERHRWSDAGVAAC